MSVKLYTKNGCGYCTMAKNWLKNKDISFEEINIEEQPQAREFVISEGHRTMPQIYINEKSIGGYQQLVEYDVSKL
jgi:glutaredoxin